MFPDPVKKIRERGATMNDLARHALTPHAHAVFLALGLTLAAEPVSADEVVMRDGSRLRGEVIKRENSTLHFKTDFAGVIQITWDKVADIKTDKPMEVLLTDDSIVTGTHIINNVDDLVVEGESGLPPQTLGQDVIDVINPESWRKGQGHKLSGRINFAFERQRGNTDDDEIDVDGDLTWRRKNDRFTAFGELERDKTDDKLTTEKWKLEGSYNYFVTKKWYWGGFGRLEHDKFADLDLRTSVGPLIGYQWFESRKMNLRTATGLAYVNEDFYDERDDDYLALPWSVDFDRYVFGEFMQFYHKQTGFWSLKDTSDVVWDTWTGLRFPLILGLVASTEIKVEYDSGAAEGADTTDTTYSLKLGYQW
jgi:putative salt-induced outer membrane protein YdiY